MTPVRIPTSRRRCITSCRTSPIFRRGYLDARKVSFQHQLQNVLGIKAIVPLFAHSLRSNLGRISRPQLTVEFAQQTLEPTRVPGSLDPDTHADSFCLQLAIELLGCFQVS